MDLTRRQFIRKTAAGAAVLSVPLVLGPSVSRALTLPAGEKMRAENYLEHFGVSTETMNAVMQTALSKGGDYCDLYFQHAITNYVMLEDGAVNRAYTNVDLGVGIRVLKGDQTGYSFTEELSDQSMKLAAATAGAIAAGGKGLPPVNLQALKTPDFYPIETSWEQVAIDQRIPHLQTINKRIFETDKRVIKATVYLADVSSHVLVATSEGKLVYDYQPMTRLMARCTAEQKGDREQGYFDLAGRRGIEFFTPETVERVSREAVGRTVGLFEAVKPDAGEMPVVLAAGSSGILLHEAIGHGMEADFNRKDVSIFADKIGKRVAEKFVNIIDDGTNPHVRGTINIDDEANDSQVTYLVKDGILQSYLHDRISAAHYKVAPTGSGRRQSFRYSPQPRMRNTYMTNGPHTRDEIIASVKNGILAETFTNGQVFIGAGDFTFYVKTGYLIEDGKLTQPIKDINIIGNGPKVLEDVSMVANDFKMAEGGWTCGKNGQGVPVSMGLPTIKVKAITVGGVS